MSVDRTIGPTLVAYLLLDLTIKLMTQKLAMLVDYGLYWILTWIYSELSESCATYQNRLLILNNRFINCFIIIPLSPI